MRAEEICLLNVGLTRTRVPTATPEDDRGEKAEPRRYALLTLIRHCVGGSSGRAGAEEATAACTSEGYLTRNQPASIPGMLHARVGQIVTLH